MFRITAHCFTKDFKRHKLNLDISPIAVAHSGSNIRAHFENILSKWPGAKQKMYAIVRDGASSNKVVWCLLTKLLKAVHNLQAFGDFCEL